MTGVAISATGLLVTSKSLAAEPAYVTTVKPVYTTRLKDASGGYNQFMSKLKVSFAKLNEGLSNSNISFEAQMVFPQEVPALVANPFNQFSELWNVKIKQEDSHGVWSGFNNQGADHLAYFDSVGTGSGLSFGTATPLTFNGGVGNNVFRHEMGHNFGCPHSSGFQSSQGNTIMNGNSLPYFSGTDVVLNGVTLGDANHNSKGIINGNRQLVTDRGNINVNISVANTWFVISKHNGLAVDAAGGSNNAGTAIIQWPLHLGANQQWHFNNFSGGASTFERSGSGARFLTFMNGTNGTGMTMENWAAGKQRFFVEEQPDGYVRIRRDDGNQVMDIPGSSNTHGTQYIQWNWNGGNNQKFKLVQKID